MPNRQRTLHNLLLVAAATLSLVAISSPAKAQVDVQISVPGIVVDARDPYYYSRSYCDRCWYGEWGGRTGYHRGGGRPWERAHTEWEHNGHEHGRNFRHQGHYDRAPG